MKPLNLNKSVILLLISLIAIALPACKKDPISPSSPTITNQNPTPTPTTTINPMDRLGKYKMIHASNKAEMDTSLVITLTYHSFKYYSADTTQKVYRYAIENNYNPQTFGKARLAKNILYENEGTNVAQPYIEVYGDTLKNGFLDCSKLAIADGGRFSGDTLILKLDILKPTPAYRLTCKYLKK